MELLELAKNSPMTDNDNGNFFAGPEYIRKSDAELERKVDGNDAGNADRF
jgi:hypothetical protein